MSAGQGTIPLRSAALTFASISHFNLGLVCVQQRLVNGRIDQEIPTELPDPPLGPVAEALAQGRIVCKCKKLVGNGVDHVILGCALRRNHASATGINQNPRTSQVKANYRESIRQRFQNDHAARITQAGKEEHVMRSVHFQHFVARHPRNPTHTTVEAQIHGKTAQPPFRGTSGDDGEFRIRKLGVKPSERAQRQVNALERQKQPNEKHPETCPVSVGSGRSKSFARVYPDSKLDSALVSISARNQPQSAGTRDQDLPRSTEGRAGKRRQANGQVVEIAHELANLARQGKTATQTPWDSVSARHRPKGKRDSQLPHQAAEARRDERDVVDGVEVNPLMQAFRQSVRTHLPGLAVRVVSEDGLAEAFREARLVVINEVQPSGKPFADRCLFIRVTTDRARNYPDFVPCARQPRSPAPAHTRF